MSRGLAIDRRGKLVVPESSLEAAIFDLLSLDNWHVFRFGWALTEAKRELSEVGSADLLAIRYGNWQHSEAEVLWCEVKSAKGKLSPAQKLWIIGERRRGADVIVAGEDFTATVDGWLEYYRASGLMRRPI